MVNKLYCEGCEHYKQHTPMVGKCHAKSKGGRMLYNIDRCPKLPPKPRRRRKDLVDVVRCKDCKNYQSGEVQHEYERCRHHWSYVEEDDYCSYGERKEP